MAKEDRSQNQGKETRSQPEKLNYSRPIIESEAPLRSRNHYPTEAVKIIPTPAETPAPTTTQQGKAAPNE